MRVFAAIDISEEARRHVAGHIERLSYAIHPQSVRWERPEKLHLTVRFFGSITGMELEKICGAIEKAAASVRRFNISLNRTGVFPTNNKARVLWIGVDDIENSIARLKFEIEARLIGGGFASESRPLTPHLTIARIKHPQTAKAVVERHLAEPFEPIGFAVRDVALYESTPLKSGSVYTPIQSFQLFRTG